MIYVISVIYVHCELKAVRGVNVVDGLAPALEQHRHSGLPHHLAGVGRELDDLALRHLGDGGDVAADHLPLERGVRVLRHQEVEPEPGDLGVELAVELAEGQHGLRT